MMQSGDDDDFNVMITIVMVTMVTITMMLNNEMISMTSKKIF